MAVQTVLKKMGLVSSVLAVFGAIALFGMMLLTLADVVGRYVFNSPVLGAFEITEFLVLILIFSFLAYTQAQKTHVSVDLIFNCLPRKARTVVDIFNHAVCFLFMILITWMSALNALDLKEVGENSPNLTIPDYPFAFFLVLGCAVTSFEFLRDLIGLFANLKEGDE